MWPGRPLQRVEPQLPVWAMRTHEILAPAATHWRPATCAEIECPDYLNGWMTPITGLDEGDLWQLEHCGRRYRRADVDGHGPVYVYEPGQPCLKASTHRTRIDRPELYVVRPGDWRVSLREAARHGEVMQLSGPDAWKDHMQSHVDKITER